MMAGVRRQDPMRLHLAEVIFGLWCASELCLILAKRSKSDATPKDRKSLGVILLVNSSACVPGFVAASHLHACELPWPKLVFGFGSCVFVLGVALRWYSVIHLGRFFTMSVAISRDHQLVDSGPYHFVRHPSYTGSLLAVFGFTLILLQNWAALLIILVPICAVILWRIHIEEEALLGALGERYRSYMRRTNCDNYPHRMHELVLGTKQGSHCQEN